MPRNLRTEFRCAKRHNDAPLQSWQRDPDFTRTSTARERKNLEKEFMQVVPVETTEIERLGRFSDKDLKKMIRFCKKLTGQEDCAALLESVFSEAAYAMRSAGVKKDDDRRKEMIEFSAGS